MPPEIRKKRLISKIASILISVVLIGVFMGYAGSKQDSVKDCGAPLVTFIMIMMVIESIRVLFNIIKVYFLFGSI